MDNKKKIIFVISLALIVATVAGVIFYGGYKLGYSQTRNIRIEGVANMYPESEVAADFSVFWQAWNKIQEYHLRADEFSAQDMIYGAIKGLAENLGDAHTTFFSAEEAVQFQEGLSGEFGGIGAELETRNRQIMVIAPLKNTPAERAGLLPRDIIIRAGDIELLGKTVQEAVKIIRGEPGTVIKLIVSREGIAGTKEIEITREVIILPIVEWELKDDNIAYIQIMNFGQNAPFAFRRVAREIIDRNPRAIILDLRNNPGGYLETAVNLAGWFIERGEVVVKERYATRQDRVFYSHGNAELENFPLIILVNKGTASAAEIMAGAIRDVNGTRLIGETTFGKGTVQTLEELKDGSVLKITVAHWVTPGGHIIEGEGLSPDIIIERPTRGANDTQEDPQLNKALEILRN